MFSFGKKKEVTKVTDVVFMKVKAKWHACVEANKKDATIFIAWFEETQRQLQAFFEEQNTGNTQVILYRQVATHFIAEKQLIFVEHYPLREKENALYASLDLREVTVFSSLEDPLFQHFGGNKIIEVMQKMGLQENEAVQHGMINMALKNAQEKIAKKILIEQSAQSQEEWFKRNVTS